MSLVSSPRNELLEPLLSQSTYGSTSFVSQQQELLNEYNNSNNNRNNRNNNFLSKAYCVNKAAVIFLLLLLGAFLALIIYLSTTHSNLFHSGSNTGIVSNAYAEDNSISQDYSEEALEDLITSLPGYDISSLSFKSFSGYLTIEDGKIEREIFYWFVESQNDPDTDPLVLWTNGGPGCSGLMGLLTEQGPYWVDNEDGLYTNEYAWNKIMNMVFVEQPYGVGFSVADNGDGIVAGDDRTTTDLYKISLAFLDKFPKYKSNDFYISAESYGGHYMPETSLKILEGNDEGENEYINFKGMLVGNPYTDYYENAKGWMRALYGHGTISNELWDEWTEHCETTSEIDDGYCDYLYVESELDTGLAINFYGLDWDNCLYDSDDSDLDFDDDSKLFKYGGKSINGRMRKKIMSLRLQNALNSEKVSDTKKLEYQNRLDNLDEYYFTQYQKLYNEKKKRKIKKNNKNRKLISSDGNSPYWACGEEYMTTYLRRPDVIEAIHAKSTVSNWSDCSDAVYDAWPSADWYRYMESIYDTLVNDYNIDIMIYSGDDDSVCGVQGTKWWLANMGYEVKKSQYHKIWYDNKGETGGYYYNYLKPGTDNETAIHFITVRSAGHEVPTFQPRRSLMVVKMYFENNWP